MRHAIQETQRPGKLEAIEAIKILRHYIGASQLEAIGHACRGEEKEFFFSKLVSLADQVRTMPRVYEQEPGNHNRVLAYEAQGMTTSDAQAVVDAEDQRGPIAHLHYFTGGCDWYITERDTSEEQHQAFGLANLGYGPELGYISIAELVENGAELDLYYTPKPLKEIKT